MRGGFSLQEQRRQHQVCLIRLFVAVLAFVCFEDEDGIGRRMVFSLREQSTRYQVFVCLLLCLFVCFEDEDKDEDERYEPIFIF